MRNLFDQYSQPENRLTHALMELHARGPGTSRQFRPVGDGRTS